MSKERFKCYYCNGIENIIVEDTINNETYIEDNIVNLLNQQAERIAELEEQLTEVGKMMPKFRIGQEVWYLYQRSIFAYEEIKKGRIGAIETFINDIDEKSIKYMIYRFNGDCDLYTTSEHYVFNTEEEAKLKLEELRGK